MNIIIEDISMLSHVTSFFEVFLDLFDQSKKKRYKL